MRKLGRRKTVNIGLLDVAVLLHHVYLASSDPKIGYNDANESIFDLQRKVKGTLTLGIETVEKLLYYGNILDEDSKFWHHRGYSFDEFVESLDLDYKYDRRYSYFKGLGEDK